MLDQTESKPVRGRGRRLVTLIAAALLTPAALVLTAPFANAAGKTGSTAGCYAQWWNTAFAGYCVNTTQNVNVRLVGDCNWAEGDYYGPFRYIGRGSTVSPFDSQECRFAVDSAYLGFR